MKYILYPYKRSTEHRIERNVCICTLFAEFEYILDNVT